jgi:hypothetical protein
MPIVTQLHHLEACGTGWSYEKKQLKKQSEVFLAQS